jgi:exodeoxyribonuclease V beta subunit
MSVTEVPAAPAPPRLAAAAPPDLRPPRQLPRRAFALDFVHSFSSLVATGESAEPIAVDTNDPAAPALVAAPPQPARGIFAFARGARAGQCLHEILEHLDLARPDGAEARALVVATLSRHGLRHAEAHDGELDPVADTLAMLRATADALLPGATVPSPDAPAAELPLARLCSGPRAAEWQFHLRLGRTSVASLANVFVRHGLGRVAAYAARLRELPVARLQGYLTGFADLVVDYHGCHFVLDWKSNHLGNDLADYGPDALWAAMQEHDYVLQYHLYLLALHRHLRARLRDYDYERHCGGAVYVFLRGVRAGTTSGVHADRPAKALVEALDRWAEGGDP